MGLQKQSGLLTYAKNAVIGKCIEKHFLESNRLFKIKSKYLQS